MESLQQPQMGEAGVVLESDFRYVEPAPLDEVMMEQLEFLLLHSRSGPHAQCMECTRLDKVSRHLMTPFW
jgi:hypothetical protein